MSADPIMVSKLELHEELVFLKIVIRSRILFICLTLAGPLFGSGQWMSLEEVQPGMRGEWMTEINPEGRRSYPFEVVGILNNHRGPGLHAILARALDPVNRMYGPVAGMSGSPCYIEGRLIGAYSFGYTWQKGEDAVFGITPIESMMALLDDLPQELPDREGIRTAATRQGIKVSSEDASPSEDLRHAPLYFGGISKTVLDAFSEELREAGLKMGGSIDASFSSSLSTSSGGASTVHAGKGKTMEAGDAVAAVLMEGDFSAAAIGTITWREQDQLLAFGHPFQMLGHTAIPLAPAEVFTVVDSFPIAYKLGQAGPSEGTLIQDRVTGVTGRLDQLPHTLNLKINLYEEDGSARQFRSKVFEHPRIGPVLTGLALAEALLSTLETGETMTLRLEGTVLAEGLEPIHFEQVTTGPPGAIQMVRKFISQFRRLLFNGIDMPKVLDVELSVFRESLWRQSQIREVWLENARLRPGGTLDLAFRLGRFLEPDRVERLQIPLPDYLQPGETVEVWLGSGQHADALEGRGDLRPASLEAIAREWSQSRPNNAVYVKLLRRAEGIQTEAARLPGLPASMLEIYAAPAWALSQKGLDSLTLWETSLPVEGEFIGQTNLYFTLEP